MCWAPPPPPPPPFHVFFVLLFVVAHAAVYKDQANKAARSGGPPIYILNSSGVRIINMDSIPVFLRDVPFISKLWIGGGEFMKYHLHHPNFVRAHLRGAQPSLPSPLEIAVFHGAPSASSSASAPSPAAIAVAPRRSPSAPAASASAICLTPALSGALAAFDDGQNVALFCSGHSGGSFALGAMISRGTYPAGAVMIASAVMQDPRFHSAVAPLHSCFGLAAGDFCTHPPADLWGHVSSVPHLLATIQRTRCLFIDNAEHLPSSDLSTALWLIQMAKANDRARAAVSIL